MNNTMAKKGAISPADMKMFYLTDDPEDAVEYIVRFHREAALPVGERRIRSPLRRRRNKQQNRRTAEPGRSLIQPQKWDRHEFSYVPALRLNS